MYVFVKRSWMSKSFFCPKLVESGPSPVSSARPRSASARMRVVQARRTRGEGSQCEISWQIWLELERRLQNFGLISSTRVANRNCLPLGRELQSTIVNYIHLSQLLATVSVIINIDCYGAVVIDTKYQWLTTMGEDATGRSWIVPS